MERSWLADQTNCVRALPMAASHRSRMRSEHSCRLKCDIISPLLRAGMLSAWARVRARVRVRVRIRVGASIWGSVRVRVRARV